MSAQIVNLDYLHGIHSPFSGLPADGEDGPNESDDSLLLIYYGDANLYAYVSDRVSKLLPGVEDMSVEQLAAGLTIKNTILLVVDTGWNGVNYYAFAPAPERE